jgi:hypothetical protein
MHIERLGACAVFALALAACGHSGSAVVPAPRAASAVTAPTPAPSVGAAASAKRSTMTISISIPAKKASGNKRAAKTVSPSTAYVDVVLKSLDGDAQPVNGPYSSLVPVSQLGACGGGGGGRAHGRTTQSASGCVTVSVAAPVGNAIYAVAAVDSSMTLLDYADSVPVTVTSSGAANLSATLNGAAASVKGFTLLTNPLSTTGFETDNAVGCPANVVQYEPKAVCAFAFDALDAGGDDMAASWTPASHGYLANALALSVTDVTAQQPLNIAYGSSQPNAASPVYEIDFDPANPGGGLTGTTLAAGLLYTYGAVVHPDLSEISAGSAATVEFKAVLQPPATTAFGDSIVMPQGGPSTFVWDLTCKNVTVGANDASGVAEGTALQYCLPQESDLHLGVQ